MDDQASQEPSSYVLISKRVLLLNSCVSAKMAEFIAGRDREGKTSDFRTNAVIKAFCDSLKDKFEAMTDAEVDKLIDEIIFESAKTANMPIITVR